MWFAENTYIDLRLLISSTIFLTLEKNIKVENTKKLSVHGLSETSFFKCPISSLELIDTSGPYDTPVNVVHMLRKDIHIPLNKIFNPLMKTGAREYSSLL